MNIGPINYETCIATSNYANYIHCTCKNMRHGMKLFEQLKQGGVVPSKCNG